MSARVLVQVAVVARLRGTAGLAEAAVFDAPPVRATLPYVQLDEPILADWSTKSWAGREAMLTLRLYDGGERPVRLRALLEAAEAAVLSLPAALYEGWRVASVALLRSRLVRAGDRWAATSEFRVRLYAAD